MTKPLNLTTLPKQFQPFLLGHQDCKADPAIKTQIDQVFTQWFKPFGGRDYIFDGGEWVIKGPRTGNVHTTEDTHIHRINLKEILHDFIEKNGLDAHFVTPEKYLYWCEKTKIFYVVCQKMDLSNEVASLYSEEVRRQIEAEGNQKEGQMQALVNGAPERALTPIQAESLAKMTFLGYTDLSYNNLYFDKAGKVALIDSEPIKKALNDIHHASWISLIAIDWGYLHTVQGITGTAKLKLYCSDPQALKAVEKVEKDHALWAIGQLTMKIVITILAIKYIVPLTMVVLPLSAATTIFKTAMIVTLTLKTVCLTANMLVVYRVWQWSYILGPDKWGVVAIVEFEKRETF